MSRNVDTDMKKKTKQKKKKKKKKAEKKKKKKKKKSGEGEIEKKRKEGKALDEMNEWMNEVSFNSISTPHSDSSDIGGENKISASL